MHQEWEASEQPIKEESVSLLVIDQEAYISGGKRKRYIDLICPASMVYLFEDSVIVGYVELTDLLRPAGSYIFIAGYNFLTILKHPMA